MNILEGFKIRRRDTPFHRLDPRSKFAVVGSLSLLSLVFSEPLPLLILVIVITSLMAVAKVMSEWARTLKGLIPFLALVFALNFITVPYERLNFSVAMTLRLLALTSAFSLFFLTTTPDDLALAMESSGIPRDFSLMFTMSLRFVPTLARDLQIITDAFRCKGLELEKGGLITRLKNYAKLLIPLMVLEVKRSLMIAEALEARGFGASPRRVKPYKGLEMRPLDYLVSFTALLATFIIVSLNYLNLLPSWLYLRLPEPAIPIFSH